MDKYLFALKLAGELATAIENIDEKFPSLKKLKELNKQIEKSIKEKQTIQKKKK